MRERDECQLLGPVSIAIQLLMGTLIISSLLLKRQSEHPKRTWMVWTYDVSKQMLGALSIHLMNLILSKIKGGESDETVAKIISVSLGLVSDDDGSDSGDECYWFFLNLLMDTTLGIPILWCWLNTYEFVLRKLGIKNIESGNYFSDCDLHSSSGKHEPLLSAFLKQLGVFILGLVSMKCCLFLILLYFDKIGEWFANWVLGWSDPWPNFQVFLIMFVFPLLLNCFQFFCVDNIIKLSSSKLNAQNVDNFDQCSIVEHDGSFVSTSLFNKNYGAIP